MYTHIHVEELTLTGTPYGVVEAVLAVDKTQGFVRVVVIQLAVLLSLVSNRCGTTVPELDADVLVGFCSSSFEAIFRVSNRSSIEVITKRDAQHLQNGGRHVCVAVGNVGGDALWNIWPANQEWNVDVFFVRAALSW